MIEPAWSQSKNAKTREVLNPVPDKDVILAMLTHGVGTPMSSSMSSGTPSSAHHGPKTP